MKPIFEEIIQICGRQEFLERVCRKYHYYKENMPMLQQVGQALSEAIKDIGCFDYLKMKEDSLFVSITLGQYVDELQDVYLAAGQVSEAYAVEVMAGELLLDCYSYFVHYIAEQTDYVVERFYFLGSDKNYPIEQLPAYLNQVGVPVKCNAAYCMIPKKSVAFFAQLTTDHSVECEGVCVGCGRKDCPNRMEYRSATKNSDIPPVVLPYGYARIFGKPYGKVEE